MDQFLPHSNATFEGYYVRFVLATGASIIMVACTVPDGETRPHMLSFTYIPQGDQPIFQREIWVSNLSFNNVTPGKTKFSLSTPSNDGIHAHSPDHVTYRITHSDVDFAAYTTSRVPWSHKNRSSGPEAFLARLPLPLHWYVHSLASPSILSLRLPLHASVPFSTIIETPALAHIEKNWANSFPTAHIWLQAHDASRSASICGAGGKILGVEAFILGYRNAALGLEVDIRPPWAIAIAGYAAPGLWLKPEWERRRVRVVLRNWRWRMEVRVTAPRGSFFGLSAPMPGGHRLNGMAQSVKGHAEVVVWQRVGWWWAAEDAWKEVVKDKFEAAAVEFGGLYYPSAGSETRWN